ncbi:MAG TPA: ribonuclease HII [archaeon]|nr:ribonuclease HII [archaeon]
MKVLGIDEAGRGPVIGPMVLCGCLIEKDKLNELKKAGAKDSKMLTEKKREHIAKKLKKIAKFEVIKISAAQIDALRSSINLNKIEIENMQFLINKMNPDCVYIDSPEKNTKKFEKKILSGINGTKIVAENFADRKYPVVSAASIIAKVERDKEIKKLHKKYGFFGSGYTSDERTIRFLKDWIKKNKEFPDIVRKTWVTAEELKKLKEQKKLDGFL